MRIRKKPAIAIAGASWLALGLLLGPSWDSHSMAFGQTKSSTETKKPATKPLLRMSEAIVCDTIKGYEDYEPLPGAALTSDEKLLVYYRASNYRYSMDKGTYQAHLTQDAQVRKRGSKKILWQKLKMMDYTTPKQDFPPTQIYLRNTISLKGLEPGDYDLIIILHDENNESRTATQVVKFKVIPADDPEKKEKAKETPAKKVSRTTE
ncbi:MAG: hypothetical protein ACLQGP_11490 [Isosphaeraceae bacterium]